MSISKKSIDVIVPVYNTAVYLRECIDSILSQKVDQLHIILVDDGSNDGSAEICDEYAETFTNVSVVHQRNKGVMRALHIGINQAVSEYVTVVDSDDWIELDTYESLMQPMMQGIDVIIYPIVRFFTDNNYYIDHTCDFVGKCEEDDIQRILLSNMIWDQANKRNGLDPSLCNKVIKRELLLEYINKASHLMGNYGQDVAIVYPLMKKVKTLYSSEHGKYYHRQRLGKSVAKYLSEPQFVRNLLDLYEYLNKEFIGYGDIRRQIDYFYAESIQLKLKVYGEDVSRRYYLFPFAKVTYKSNVIIYGAGRIGHMYVEQISKTNYCTLQAWVDKYIVSCQSGFPVTKPESIAGLKTDAVIIAIFDRYTAENVRNELISYGIENNNIIWEMNCIKV